MDQIIVEDIDDDDVGLPEDVEIDLARMSTEDAVRYLMQHGTAEMDARFLVAMANGEISGRRQASGGPESARPA